MRSLVTSKRLHEVIDFKALQEVNSFFSAQDFPFLRKLTEQLLDERPYRDLKIVHNTHITLATLCKLQPLLVSGADVTVTVSKDLKCDLLALELLKRARIPFREISELDNSYDFSLDCCAGLLGVTDPRYGAVELTQTGSVRYKNANTAYPVISVDESFTKNLENYLGTGDGFVRALLEMTRSSIENKKFILFGYGKVGKGVVRALLPFTHDIIIVEKNQHALEQARSKGLHALHILEHDRVCEEASNTYCIVTATGVKGVLSNYFDRNDFKVSYLANIGSEDEFGEKFETQDILFKKEPINFSLLEPTRIKFLDPVFYAHNYAMNFILSGQITNGFHAYPQRHDLVIFQEWMHYHNEDLAREIQNL